MEGKLLPANAFRVPFRVPHIYVCVCVCFCRSMMRHMEERKMMMQCEKRIESNDDSCCLQYLCACVCLYVC